jgi:dehydrogenase/reductase SDR family protein 12
MMDWLLEKSLLGYTRLGYQWRRREWESLPRLAGRVAVITGATGGLGAAAAAQLRALGATVILVGRDPGKLATMRDQLQGLSHGGPVETEIADLSDMRAVSALSDRLRQRGDIDILLNNAGVLLNERRETAEGLETTFATNLLGHYILTERLLPSLAARTDARVINVSSGGMYTQRIRVDDPETRQLAYKGPEVYARTKRGQVIMTGRWAARYPAVGVYSMHPGWADTVGVQTALPGFRKLTRPLLRNADEGADTMTWLAAAGRDRLQSGAFYHDRRVWPEHRMRSTRETPAEREALEALLEAYATRLLGKDWRR